jgi:dimethylhistidine N-methyltransferase
MSNDLFIDESELKSLVMKEQCAFRNDVLTGLSKSHKEISSKYFYDAKGSDLFNQITRHPDYYLTQCEVEILHSCKYQLANLFGDEEFNLVELGPGEGIKTQILIEAFLEKRLAFSYMPIDISKMYLKKIMDDFNRKLPDLSLSVINSDYFKGLEWLKANSSRRNLVLFLGSSIGNFDLANAENFLVHLWETLNDGDCVFIGFDLKKNIETLIKAYDDTDGITRAFNLNLLQRMNNELGADFDLTQFFHYPTYNVNMGAMESYLVSRVNQVVTLDGLSQTFLFAPYEPIYVECSYKYHSAQLGMLAKVTGFDVVDMFYDEKNYFVDALWRVRK